MIGKSNISFRWDARFLDMAKLVASWSKDPSTKVGAVIVDANNRVVSLGFNGFPRGVLDVQSRLEDRETKLACTLHAELNAILFACRDLSNHSIFVYPLQPCANCAAAIIQSGIRRVVCPKLPAVPRWAANFKIANAMFFEAKVKLECLSIP